MSKRIAVIVIFAFLLIGAFLQNSFIRNTTDELFSQLQSTSEALSSENGVLALSRAENLEKTWKTHSTSMSILLDHSIIDIIDEELCALTVSIRHGDFCTADIALATLHLCFEHLVALDSPSMKIIF